MKYFKLFCMAGVVALTTACTNDDLQETVDNQQVPINLAYTTVDAEATRAATNVNQDNIMTGKTVKVYVSYNDGVSTTITGYDYGTTGTAALSLPGSNVPYYPLNGNPVDIHGLYPAAASTGSLTIEANQSTDSKYADSDLMWAPALEGKNKTSGTVTLTFQHKMAKLLFDVHAGTAVTKINSVTIKSVTPTANINTNTGVLSAASGTPIDVIAISGNNTNRAQGAAVIPAQEKAAGTFLEIGVTMSNNATATATYNLGAAKTFDAGKVYTLNITVSGPEVGTTTTISGWTANGSVTVQPSVHQQTFNVDNVGIMTFNVKGVQFNMVAVKGGSYTTFGGSAVTGTLTDFYIGQTEVTNGLWNAVMGSKPTGQTNNGDDYPVANVSWLDICGGSYSKNGQTQTVAAADAFLTKLNAALAGQLPTDKTFKLPTEAQWEYAAHSGTQKETTTYVSCSTEAELQKRAWYNANASSVTHPVATKLPSLLGLYDMNGNVWEWCQDWANDIVSAQGTDFVQGTAKTSFYSWTTDDDARVYRGGGWHGDAGYCAVSRRGGNWPSYRTAYIGLRLVLQ